MNKPLSARLLALGTACALALLLGLGSPSVGEDAVLLIAHPGVAQDALSADAVMNIYTGKKGNWDNGAKCEPIMLASGPTHDAFLQRFVRKNASQFDQFWKKAVFTGEGTPPKSAGSEPDMVAKVAATAGAVGYISAATPHDGVKVIGVK